uniref:Uncharacterized protein n=1 Tax=Callorhinchus milii TaxID=7868 RepID=A0A4W3GP44_CALMI
METFQNMLNDKLGIHFDLTFHNLCPNRRPPIFGDFMREPPVYEDLANFRILKNFMENHLLEYNAMPGTVPMRLVLFKDAIEHGTV